MKHVINGIEDLTLDLYEDVTRNGGTVEISDALKDKLNARRQEFLTYVFENRQLSLYGITTKQGVGAKVVLTDEQLSEFGERLPGYGSSFGEDFPEDFKRGAILSRAVDFLYGSNCPRAEIVERLFAMLDRDKLPHVPMRGNGDPGDIIPCGAMFAEEFNGTLQLGEGMGLINGSPFSTNSLCDAYMRTKNLPEVLEKVYALAAFAAGAPEMHYNKNLSKHWDDQYITATMDSISAHLDGTWGDEHLFYQAPCCFRSTQRVLGWFRRSVDSTKSFAEKTLQQPVNNPMFVGADEVPEFGAILSNGGWHSAYAGPVLDALTRSIADTATMFAMVNNRLCEIPGGILELESEQQISAHCMVVAGWVEEARTSATNTLTTMCNSGHTDTSTPDTLAWRKTAEAAQALEYVATIVALQAATLIELKGLKCGNPVLADLQKKIIEIVPIDTSAQYFIPKNEAIYRLLFGKESKM